MIDFNKLMDNYFSRTPRKKPIGRYYPSEIGGCLRKTWFSYKIQKPVDKDVMRIFGAGNVIHDLVANVIKSEKNPEIELLKEEMPFIINEPDFIVSGRIDDLALIKLNGKKVLIEVKSTKFLPKEANDTHVAQIQLYMHATKVYNGMILYVQKDNLQTSWFNLEYDPQKANEIMQRFQKLHDSLKANKLPIAEAKKTEGKKWMCNYCEYKEECDQHDIEETDYKDPQKTL